MNVIDDVDHVQIRIFYCFGLLLRMAGIGGGELSLSTLSGLIGRFFDWQLSFSLQTDTR
ncbi:hypothetical protein [Methylomonas lenta]|uniref:hypothetical protein n=1 Tax=Methylomonas lenta TaxID=980561 RepID=UPI0018DE4D07|nr:hypothetical protein [Methylomonas lenta]